MVYFTFVSPLTSTLLSLALTLFVQRYPLSTRFFQFLSFHSLPLLRFPVSSINFNRDNDSSNKEGEGREKRGGGKALKQRLCLRDYFQASLSLLFLNNSASSESIFTNSRHEIDDRFEKTRQILHSSCRTVQHVEKTKEEANFSFFFFSFSPLKWRHFDHMGIKKLREQRDTSFEKTLSLF